MEIFNNPRQYREWYLTHKKIYDTEKKAVEALGLKDCLDIGSGPSIFHEAIKGRVISLDVSEPMLKEGKEDEDKILADALHLPIRDNSLKCTFISVTACFINEVDALFKEVARVSDSVSVCIVAADSPWGEFYQELGKRGHKYYSRAHFITRDELIKTVSRYFKVVKIVSTLTFSPLEDERDEEPLVGDASGAFFCVKGIKAQNSSKY
ncbi:MAG: type 11 methyltransferase [Candidatus Aramenus sulfurataquae]|jgi:ubiquinone/menaquinone biosynthesis C-methylase UbiE|uniref:Methyltransferase n=2 Tax=Candidatus Aramenus sulfurataquae TaxID=1326980 RepID=W7KW25_9CREN|nr:MAG: type 11 methyltransferase [Candidatus Aramenus sulfurataquae]MCL7343696.1 class I SAM-dependent methyltransferase [Candidatus Aramenus sulfurataquae]